MRITKLKKNMNLDVPEIVGPASARGLSSILDRLAKSQGRGGDVLIDMDCTVQDVVRMSLKTDMEAALDKFGGS